MIVAMGEGQYGKDVMNKNTMTRGVFRKNRSYFFRCRCIWICLIFLILSLSGSVTTVGAEDGYDLWLRYRLIDNPEILSNYRQSASYIVAAGDSATLAAAAGELQRGLSGLLGQDVPRRDGVDKEGAVLVGSVSALRRLMPTLMLPDVASLGEEGYLLLTVSSDSFRGMVITARTDAGVLYGVFGFLRELQTRRPLDHLEIRQTPRIQRRMLNHWDNINGSIEQGFAGKSLWHWNDLPETLDPRYTDYARANASLGINASVINNVNADPRILSDEYIRKWAALADVFRPYNIRVYASANFAAPMRLENADKLDTADPLDPRVRNWWKQRVEAIYAQVPDFGGFLVKADAERQPGPRQFGRQFNDGANMLAEALAPHGGVVIWRAFNKDVNEEADPAKRNFTAYAPLNGKFAANVFIQPKNGPIDFQPLEPFHPLFGRMPNTPLLLELQVTQEYLGKSVHHVYLAPLWKDVLSSDTCARGDGSTVARVIDGSLYERKDSGITGVANTGSDRNWCSHHFAQANWYAFGRLAWDHTLSAEQIAEEWLRMTFSNDPEFVTVTKGIMMDSWPAAINYQTPLGLSVVAGGNHYDPSPKTRNGRQYWFADKDTIGIDRTTGGSGAVQQYNPPLAELFNNVDTCPERLLLWFHRVSWQRKLSTGRTLWEELVWRYYDGVRCVEDMNRRWATLKPYVDAERFAQTTAVRQRHLEHARLWRDTCVAYFQSISQLPLPEFITTEFGETMPRATTSK